MAFLGKGRKEDLRTLASELGLAVSDDLKVINLRELIIKSDAYEEELVKNMLTVIIEDRLKTEKVAEEEERLRKVQTEEENERKYELEKLKLQLEAHKVSSSTVATRDSDYPKFEISHIIPRFDPKEHEIGLFLIIFERQLKFMNLPESSWVPYLIGSLPTEIAQLLAREDEQEFQNYKTMKEMLLKRFRVTADKFRKLFSQHRKGPDTTWRDYFFELASYFEGWLEELDVRDFEKLKQLIIADQIKKKVPPEVKEHFIDIWSEWITPVDLVEKLDGYEHARCGMKKSTPYIHQKKIFPPKQPLQERKPHFQKGDKIKKEGPTEIVCYGCGTPGVIKPKCPSCKGKEKNNHGAFSSVILQLASSPLKQLATLEVTINGVMGTACADTAATHSIAGERLYHILKTQGATFTTSSLIMSLADGSKIEREVHTTCVKIRLGGRTLPLNLVAIPEAKKNNTLLGIDFLESSGIVINLRRKTWFFNDQPKRQFRFVEQDQESCDAVNLNISQTAAPLTVKETDHPDHSHEDEDTPSTSIQQLKLKDHPDQLREDEGTHLTDIQKKKLNELLFQYKTSFQPGGVPTPFIEHRINTGNNLPVSEPPYRMTPAKKELLQTELQSLLAEGIIEECESPYASPVVLVPKPNGSIRLCIDYRKLNATTIPDTYPLPRMDDLLNEAKSTKFMSTIDLRAGYHQVKVYEADQEKTAFICPFGTFKFLRMPFGLRNAPATFQRLIDKFRSGLKDVFALSYLDDIIVLSENFDKHLSDLKEVFERLSLFKLNANRSKCHFACDRVKYLGHYITKKGIEVDPDKVLSIQKIPEPTCVKEVQSFLQTCSWFRRYVPHFSEVARPLSELTKKNKPWTWGEAQRKAFEELKGRLISPPVLSQPDGTKPFIIRTDASSYALGAVLIQGERPEEHVIEYASRLLSSAEKNYSTTEREALAVVWALEKFRGYVENQDIIIASDHQPLKWLMSIKSPSGRLARWALQIQSYHPKIQYTPGKSNVVADLLSRPIHENRDFVCDLNTISIELPSRKSRDIRDEQMKDEDVKKIINCFESGRKDEDFINWTSRGYLMNQGILYRYSSDTESEEAQLVVPLHERDRVLQQYHDSPTAGHSGAEGTYFKIASRYYFPGMRKYIAEYVKNCAECNRYKPNNQKPAGLLRTPIYAQRFETLAIDLFGPLPETPTGKRWIFLVEDTSTKWVELFALEDATASNCAKILIEEVFLRYGLPRRLISDNGTQFVSAVMQQTCHFLGIKQDLIPVYHPQANPSERKNRDLKPKLAILVGDAHETWEDKLAMIRFAMNTSKCDSTGHTAAYLQFGRELRTTDDVNHDLRSLIENDNFVAEITPYLRQFAHLTPQIKERVEQKQDQRKKYFDKKRRQMYYQPGDKVWVNLHPVSRASNKRCKKFFPKREGPYLVITNKSPTTYALANPDTPEEILGTYHTSMLRPYELPAEKDSGPRAPIKRRGRPRKNFVNPDSSSGRLQSPRGSL